MVTHSTVLGVARSHWQNGKDDQYSEMVPHTPHTIVIIFLGVMPPFGISGLKLKQRAVHMFEQK